MYDLLALQRKISKEGLPKTIRFLQSNQLPSNIKEDLTREGVFVNGKVNISLLRCKA